MTEKLSIRLFKSITKGNRLIIIGIIGIALIGISSFFPAEKEQTPLFETVNSEQYKAYLEKQIGQVVEGITGDKKAKVIITLETGVRREYATDTETKSSEKNDSSGASTGKDNKKTAITVKTADGSETALIVTEYMPQIRGVAIVYKSKNKTNQNEAIISAVTAVLGITSKRVYVGGYAG